MACRMALSGPWSSRRRCEGFNPYTSVEAHHRSVAVYNLPAVILLMVRVHAHFWRAHAQYPHPPPSYSSHESMPSDRMQRSQHEAVNLLSVMAPSALNPADGCV
jgi:hypothetical protein